MTEYLSPEEQQHYRKLIKEAHLRIAEHAKTLPLIKVHPRVLEIKKILEIKKENEKNSKEDT